MQHGWPNLSCNGKSVVCSFREVILLFCLASVIPLLNTMSSLDPLWFNLGRQFSIIQMLSNSLSLVRWGRESERCKDSGVEIKTIY